MPSLFTGFLIVQWGLAWKKSGGKGIFIKRGCLAVSPTGMPFFTVEDTLGIPSNNDIMNWYKRAQQDLKSRIEALRPQLAAKAQQRYDEWEQDDEGHDEWMGFGGICHEIADLFSDVFLEAGIDTTSIHFDDVNHVACVAYDDDEGYIVDMPCGLYERGGGYRWRKIKDVVFEPSDITISRISRDDVQGVIDHYG